MADLLLTLRGLTSAGSAEYTVNGSAYWTDDQLEDVLDRHVKVIRYEQLTPYEIVEAGGSVSYYDYQSKHRFFESTSGGTARFIVRDSAGSVVGTASYTPDYPYGLVKFSATTGGLSYYLDGYSYDMNAAAADVWQQKAAHYVTAYDVSTDNHNLRRSQIIQNCLVMSKEFASGARVYSVTVERGDTED
jgi:hypothetical protein